MIKKALPFVIILLFPIIYSCDQLEELTGWDLNTEAAKDFIVNITEEDNLSIDESFTISIDDPEVQENINKIDEWKVNKVSYQIWSYTGPIEGDVLLSGTLDLGPVDVSLSNVNLNQMFMSQTVAELDLTDQELVNLANALRSTKSITGTLIGNVTDKPVYFIIYVKLDLTLRIQA